MNLRTLGTLFLALVSALTAGCGGTTTGNPQNGDVTVAFSSYTARHWFELISSAYAATSDVKLCFKRLRFKTTSDSESAENIDLAIGEVTLSPGGTSLTAVSVPQGTYRRIEFDLDPTCTSGHSVTMTNGNGNFASTDSITIRFDGAFTVVSGSQILPLAAQAIITQLNNVNSNSSIKTFAEAAGGTF